VTRLGSVLVIAKEPLPGRVKTRLTPPYSPEQAAALAAAAIADTLRAAMAVPADRHVLVLDGSPGDWIPAGWDVVAQGAGDLDDRLGQAFDDVRGNGPAVLVGMDTPQATATQINAFAPHRFDCCLGRADDGGFWLIGFADPSDARAAIVGVPMSRDDTGTRQLERLQHRGLTVQLIDQLTDVDDAASATQAALAAPHTEFAQLLARTSPMSLLRPNLLHV
jgi:glycosyltransferase A (GT-A) superfamily protein (DUF2064 family)